MIKSIKVMLKPNNRQSGRMFQYAGSARFVYNWVLAKQKENYDAGNKFIKENELKSELTKLKKTEDFKWLKCVSSEVTAKAITDACDAFIRFFNHEAKYPTFKTRKHSKPSFYQSPVYIKISSTHVDVAALAGTRKLSRIGFNSIKLSEYNKIPVGVNYSNPRFTHDGLDWFVSVGVEYPDNMEIPLGESIGIDLGIKDLAILNDGTKFKNINKTSRIKKLKKKLKRLQRTQSRKYEMNKEGVKFIKTCNISKQQVKINKVYKRLTNIRLNHTHNATSEIIKRKPSLITIEDLNIKGMMQNRHLSKAVAEQNLHEFRRQIEYKASMNNIKFVVADRWFASSKTCSGCGNIKNDLKLKDREYICCECGIVLDRDINAAININEYGIKLTYSEIK